MLRDWRNFYKSKREEGLFSVEAFVAGGVNSALEGGRWKAVNAEE